MKGPWLLRVTAPPADFLPLVTAARELGLRVGWLELAEPEPPAVLSAALTSGCAKAVALGPGGSLAAKALRGPAVLGDVLREHFRGNILVLIQGEGLALPADTASRLEVTGAVFTLVFADGTRQTETATTLAGRLRSKNLRQGAVGSCTQEGAASSVPADRPLP